APSQAGLGPASEIFDKGAAAVSKFFIGLLLGQFLFWLVDSGMNQELSWVVGTVVVLILLYLVGTAIRYLLQSLGAILRSPVIDSEITWSSLTR
ncbi:MAG: hypothetical protein L3K17_03760, partial [Thermoplasmata archaeon]|nr:hypothetical protein [Thermoplasmata archaeon]